MIPKATDVLHEVLSEYDFLMPERKEKKQNKNRREIENNFKIFARLVSLTLLPENVKTKIKLKINK